MAALRSRCGHYIFALWFLSLFSSPNLSGQRLDVYHTSTHGVALVQVWNVLHAARSKYRTQKSPSAHHRTTLSSYIFAIKAWGKLVKQQYLLACPYNMVNFGPLTAEICWRVWGTTASFNGFRVLAALLHGTLVVGVSQTGPYSSFYFFQILVPSTGIRGKTNPINFSRWIA